MKITQPMVSVLKKMGDGAEYDEFDVSGPLSLASRVRTCNALVKRGLMTQTLFGHYLLTDAGEALANTFNTAPADQQAV